MRKKVLYDKNLKKTYARNRGFNSFLLRLRVYNPYKMEGSRTVGTLIFEATFRLSGAERSPLWTLRCI